MENNNVESIRSIPYGNVLPSGQNKKDRLPPLPTEGATPMPFMPSSPSMGSPAPGMQPFFPGSAGFPPTGAPAPSGGYPFGQSPAFQGMTGGMTQGMGMPPAQQGITSTSPSTGGYGFQSGITPLTPFNQPVPVTTENIMYLNAFLRTMIGRRVTVDFLIGTNTIQDRTGTLLAVGANYIVINEVETDDILTCDFFSIKFVRVYY